MTDVYRPQGPYNDPPRDSLFARIPNDPRMNECTVCGQLVGNSTEARDGHLNEKGCIWPTPRQESPMGDIRWTIYVCPECGRVTSVPEWCKRPVCVHAWDGHSPEVWDGDDTNGEGRRMEESPEESFREPGPRTWSEMVPAGEPDRELVEAVKTAVRELPLTRVDSKPSDYDDGPSRAGARLRAALRKVES